MVTPCYTTTSWRFPDHNRDQSRVSGGGGIDAGSNIKRVLFARVVRRRSGHVFEPSSSYTPPHRHYLLGTYTLSHDHLTNSNSSFLKLGKLLYDYCWYGGDFTAFFSSVTNLRCMCPSSPDTRFSLVVSNSSSSNMPVFTCLWSSLSSSTEIWEHLQENKMVAHNIAHCQLDRGNGTSYHTLE